MWLGAVMSFFLNRSFTFRSDETLGPFGGKVRPECGGVLCARIRRGTAVGGLILGRTSLPTVWRDRLTKLGGMALYTGFNYFGQRFFAFRRR